METIQHGIDTSTAQAGEAGCAATWLGREGEDGAGAGLESALRSSAFDCVVIGAGIRLLPQRTPLLETLVGVVRRTAPSTRIASATNASDALAAVQRYFPSSTD